jgi:uncharacterized protein involved in exopolysaccharide biosynthesis
MLKRNKDLRDRVAELERENEELKKIINKYAIMEKDFKAKEEVFKKHLDKQKTEKNKNIRKWLYGYPGEKYGE